MNKEIELGANHSTWMMKFYNHFIITDHDAENRLTAEEKNERVNWCTENLNKTMHYDRGNVESWCWLAQVNKWGTCPYRVFYFMYAEDAMAFKLRWL